MSLQDKIAQSQIDARSKLHDYMISQVGTETKVIRITTSKNLEGDVIGIEILNHSLVTLRMTIPDEIPITRLRKDVTESITTTDNVFFYDILPIEIFAKYTDEIAKGDIIIRKLKRENETFYHILQVTGVLGNYRANYLTYDRYQCAPYSYPLPSQVQDIIDSYKEL